MIIDSHCHSWQYWPYQNKNNHEPNQIPVPNPETWGNIDQLNYEMKINNIDYATIVSAQIWHNPNNNNYINGAIKNQKIFFNLLILIATGQKLTKLMGLWRDLKKMIYLKMLLASPIIWAKMMENG